MLPSPQERCQGGNIFGLLASKILELALTSVEDAMNGFVVDPVNAAIRAVTGFIPFIGGKNALQIPRACLTGYWRPGGDCFWGDANMAAYFGCYGTNRAAAHKMCIWARQKSICMGSDGAYERYKSLFTVPSGDELESRYRSFAGDSFNVIDPTFKAVFNSVQSSVQREDVREAQDICDSSILESMDLDDIIISCTPRSQIHEPPRRCADMHPTIRRHLPLHRGLLPVRRLERELQDVSERDRVAAAQGGL